MKITMLSRLSAFALPLVFGAALGCGPDKDEDSKAEDAVEEAGDDIEDGVEEAGDEIEDATE